MMKVKGRHVQEAGDVNALNNTVTLAENDIIDHADCEECTEDYMFSMKDQEGRQFCIGLKTILDCLLFAEREHAVPAISDEWWKRALGRN